MKNSPEMEAAYASLNSDAQVAQGGELLHERLHDRSRLIAVGMVGPAGPRRPGVRLFFNISEQTFYDPLVPAKAAEFEFFVYLWNDIIWALGVFPWRHREKLERVARRCDLRFANGVPQAWLEVVGHVEFNAIGAARGLIRPTAEPMFPLPSPSVFTLETIPVGAKLTLKQEDDQVNMWRERARDHSRASWWPEVVV